MKVVWVHNDQTIPDTPEFCYRDDGGGHFSLVIRDIFPEDAGVYFCEAYNKHGSAHCHAQLSIHGGLLVRQDIDKDIDKTADKDRDDYPQLDWKRLWTVIMIHYCWFLAVIH